MKVEDGAADAAVRRGPAPVREPFGASAPARHERPAPVWYSHGLNRMAYYRVAGAVGGALPRGLRLRMARLAGRAIGRRLARERGAVRRNLARVLPALGPSALEAKVSETFANFAVCFADLLTLNRGADAGLSPDVVAIGGDAHLDAGLAHGRGAILLTAHLANWELAGRLLARLRERPTHVVLSAEQDHAVEGYLRLGGPHLTFVTRRDATSTLGLMAALRRGELVAMQGDRATGERGDATLPFFGAPAAFPLGPFVLARAAGAPVVPAFCAMVPGGGYRISVEAPIWVEPGEEMSALAAVVAALERAVRARPTEWFNFYDVWEGRGGAV